MTTIQFEDGEDMKGVFLGDSIAWQVVPKPPRGNRLFLKPMVPDAITNMTVVTDKRTYLFQLSDAKAKRVKPTYIVRFVYPRYDQQSFQSGEAVRSAALNNIAAKAVNTNYSVAGKDGAKRSIRLKTIHDDGQFTYFRFDDGSDGLPGVYVVQADGTEATVNQRREGDYLVVEQVANNFTLRRGSLHVCVRNNKRIAEEAQARRNTNEDSDRVLQPSIVELTTR